MDAEEDIKRYSGAPPKRPAPLISGDNEIIYTCQLHALFIRGVVVVVVVIVVVVVAPD